MKAHSAHADFHWLMKELLHFMGMDVSSALNPEVYSFCFDEKTEIHICSPCAGMMDMVVRLGMLGDRTANNTLHKLLAMNLYSSDAIPLNVGMHPETGEVTMWLRHPLHGTDIRTLTALLATLLDRAASCTGHLHDIGRMRALPGKKHLPI